MANLKLVCFSCGHHFDAIGVNPGDFRTCFNCGARRKIVKHLVTCKGCKAKYSFVSQDGIQVSKCRFCGTSNLVHNPKLSPTGKSRKPKKK